MSCMSAVNSFTVMLGRLRSKAVYFPMRGFCLDPGTTYTVAMACFPLAVSCVWKDPFTGMGGELNSLSLTCVLLSFGLGCS